jgi:hypothetical protein
MPQSKKSQQSRPKKVLDVLVDAFPCSSTHARLAEEVTGLKNGNVTRDLLGLLDHGLAEQLPDKSWIATENGVHMVTREFPSGPERKKAPATKGTSTVKKVIFGHSPCSVVRALARDSDSWTIDSVRVMLAPHGVQMTDSTIRSAIGQGRRGQRAIADLTPEQAEELSPA